MKMKNKERKRKLVTFFGGIVLPWTMENAKGNPSH